MNLSSLKGIFQKLSFVKEYSSLVVPMLLAVLAAVLFVPTTLMQHSLAVRIEQQSNSKIQTLKTLRDEPSEKQGAEEHKRVVAIQMDTNTISLVEEHSSQRPLLRYNIFPQPAEISPQIFEQFGRQYQESIKTWAADLKARDCPSAAELSKSLNKSFGAETSMDTATLPETDKLIVQHLCMQIAESAKVYFDPTNITGYRFWEKYNYTDKDKAVEDCWYGQISYWIIEDCFQTVKKLNVNSQNVLKSPVKRIVDIGFSTETTGQSGMPFGFAMYAVSGQQDKPAYVTSAQSGLVMPLTARITNDRFDVVQFRFTVIINAKNIPDFMQELCTGKEHKFKGFNNSSQENTFSHNPITILKTKFESINPDDKDNKLYRYGTDAVVKVELVCEYVFNKKGYDEVKPESVKTKLAASIQKIGT